MKIDKLVKQITKKLDAEGLYYEVSGDQYTFIISPTCTIHTNHCTIEIHKNSITVNERPVADIEEMMEEVMEVEGGVYVD
ncbi:hypothetical protein MHB54_00895 [Paenibacillus sp. FSL M7-0802]|uniref:hypothetical protein n=1 Tax=Paenibacillus sp. FSL M7-0802 TaxID=2921536 RepID=UPI0030FA7FCE